MHDGACGIRAEKLWGAKKALKHTGTLAHRAVTLCNTRVLEVQDDSLPVVRTDILQIAKNKDQESTHMNSHVIIQLNGSGLEL